MKVTRNFTNDKTTIELTGYELAGLYTIAKAIELFAKRFTRPTEIGSYTGYTIEDFRISVEELRLMRTLTVNIDIANMERETNDNEE